MRKISLISFLQFTLFSLVTILYTPLSHAEHTMVNLYGKVYNASNTCFPRVFSQIDQFKVSSGGLRNIHPNPRSIICSINSDSSFSVYGATPEGATVRLSFEALPADMMCTLYARNETTAAIIYSFTKTFSAGSTDGGFDEPYGAMWGNSYFDLFIYLQCKVPGNGRIFSYSGGFWHDDETID